MIVRHDGVHVDANKNSDVRHFLQVWADGEVTGRAEITYEGVKPLNVEVVLKNALELTQERLIAVICEEAGGHV